MSLEKIRMDQLQPGDILLCRGTGWLSHTICFLDGGSYCHAAFFDGKELVQATLHGIVRESVESLKNEKFVDVFRFNKDHHSLGELDWPAEPVVARAEEIAGMGLKYATDHLVLMAFLVVTRRVPLISFEKKILRTVIDHATELIAKMIDHGKTPMICSEVVYRCYAEAKPEEKYQLKVEGTFSSTLNELYQPLPTDPQLVTLAQVGEEENEKFEDSKKRFIETWMKAEGSMTTGNGNVVSMWVTPRDLETSPDLKKVGRLSFE